ncbi:hypothetical protein NX059_012319 [Plenodomus lindquistii]|nr:hypothetical protein NX059_012319 [Plenodomus lindquistii]
MSHPSVSRIADRTFRLTPNVNAHSWTIYAAMLRAWDQASTLPLTWDRTSTIGRDSDYCDTGLGFVVGGRGWVDDEVV